MKCILRGHWGLEKVILRGRCKDSETLQISSQAQCFVDVAKNEGRRLSFAGLRFTWQGQGIRTMDATFCGETGEFIRGVAFLEFDLEDAFAWPVQHFV